MLATKQTSDTLLDETLDVIKQAEDTGEFLSSLPSTLYIPVMFIAGVTAQCHRYNSATPRPWPCRVRCHFAQLVHTVSQRLFSVHRPQAICLPTASGPLLPSNTIGFQPKQVGSANFSLLPPFLSHTSPQKRLSVRIFPSFASSEQGNAPALSDADVVRSMQCERGTPYAEINGGCEAVGLRTHSTVAEEPSHTPALPDLPSLCAPSFLPSPPDLLMIILFPVHAQSAGAHVVHCTPLERGTSASQLCSNAGGGAHKRDGQRYVCEAGAPSVVCTGAEARRTGNGAREAHERECVGGAHHVGDNRPRLERECLGAASWRTLPAHQTASSRAAPTSVFNFRLCRVARSRAGLRAT
ncbi:hypothetical protein FB451DRAFT_1412633 [Mycena latifolia]|nr:hypothetical protein FB451DRAFT_1412633 [Mycena latifolia]